MNERVQSGSNQESRNDVFFDGFVTRALEWSSSKKDGENAIEKRETPYHTWRHTFKFKLREFLYVCTVLFVHSQQANSDWTVLSDSIWHIDLKYRGYSSTRIHKDIIISTEYLRTVCTNISLRTFYVLVLRRVVYMNRAVLFVRQLPVLYDNISVVRVSSSSYFNQLIITITGTMRNVALGYVIYVLLTVCTTDVRAALRRTLPLTPFHLAWR